MEINPHIFRAYDLRGIVDKDLSPEIAEHIGKAFGTFLKRINVNKAVVGFDCRASSPEYSEALMKGMTWAGIDITQIGMVMVGTFYWAQYYFKIPGGVFVTASHNPAEYNGFKFANNYSETFVSEEMQTLRKMVEEEDYEKGETMGTVRKEDIRQAYYDDLLKRVKITKKFKIVVDPSHATAGIIIPELLRQAGCEVTEKHTNIDPSFPLGTPDPTENAVAQRLAKEVRQAQADLGFSYDADGDRVGIVDHKGTIIWNDVLVALFAIDVLKDHPHATIMFNTLCSKAVPQTIQKYGGTPFMWRTGHSFLKKKNQEVKAAFIGELSGHFFFSADFHNHDDGAYSTLRLLQYLSRSNQTLHDAIESLPKYISSPEIKIGCPDDKKVALMEKIGQKLRSDFKEAEVINDERAGDGVRLDMEDSMFVIRYSQNGPYLTVKFEANTEEKYNELKQYINTLLHSYEEVDWNFGVNVESLN